MWHKPRSVSCCCLLVSLFAFWPGILGLARFMHYLWCLFSSFCPWTIVRLRVMYLFKTCQELLNHWPIENFMNILFFFYFEVDMFFEAFPRSAPSLHFATFNVYSPRAIEEFYLNWYTFTREPDSCNAISWKWIFLLKTWSSAVTMATIRLPIQIW